MNRKDIEQIGEKIVYYIPICYFLVQNSKYNVHQNITFQYLSGFRYWSFPRV